MLLHIVAHCAIFKLAEAAKLGRTLPPICAGCLTEPVESDYFAAGKGLGYEPPRLRWETLLAASQETFHKAARGGKVLLIENATAGAALSGWSCERLAQEFPEARMRREYDWVANPEDRNLQILGNSSWVQATTAGEDATDRLNQDPQAPPFAPFYWGVREHRRGDVGSKKVLERIRELITASVPKFMDGENAASLFDHAEFWLGAKGTGARAHMDSHCISTLSLVLSGERRWRIGPVPRMPKGIGRSKSGDVVFDDGVAYKMGWRPMFEFVAKQGEAVLFPPGWIHETLNTAEGCTVALTTQFNFPRPVQYYRHYYNRLRRVGDLNPCWGDMISWGSLGAIKQNLPKGIKEIQTLAERLFREWNGTFSGAHLEFYDINGDGAVAREEFLSTFVAWAATEHAIRQEKTVRNLKPDMSLADPKAFGVEAGGKAVEEL